MEEVKVEYPEEVGPSPSFKAVMHSRDLAPLVLKHLDFKALLAYSHTYRLGYQVAKYYQWGKQLIDQNLIAYCLLDYVAFQNCFDGAALRNLYLTLRNNRRFARAELCAGTVNPIFYATYGEGHHIPWHFAALLGRVDIILDLIKTNPHDTTFKENHLIGQLESFTKRQAAFYLVFAKQFDKLAHCFNYGHITSYEVSDSTNRAGLLFAGGCAGVIDIREKLMGIFQLRLPTIRNELIVIAAGLMEGGHLKLLLKFLESHNIPMIEILKQHPACLHAAAENAHRDVVDIVLSEIHRHNLSHIKAGDNQFLPIEFDSKGRSLLHYFAYNGWETEFDQLAQHPESAIEKAPEKRRFKLGLPSRKVKGETVKTIRLCPTQRDKENRTPMHFALMGGKLSMIKFCQDRGLGNIKDFADEDHTNALGIAIAAKQNHLIEPLIHQFGVDWKWIDDFGFNLLLVCASSNNWKAFTLLCQMKIGSAPLFEDPLASMTRAGRTLVHVAARQGHIPFLRQLKNHCINLGGKSYDDLFKSVDTKGNSMLHAACDFSYYIGVFKVFVEEFGCNPRQENHDKQNAVDIILLDKDKHPQTSWHTVAKIVHQYGHDLLDIKVGDRKSIRELAKEAGKEHLFEESLSLGINLAQ